MQIQMGSGSGVHLPSLLVGAVSCAAVVKCIVNAQRRKPQKFMALPDKIGTVAVYASSSTQIDESYVEIGRALGKEIASRGWVQVNGGSATGLMGAAIDGAKDGGGLVDIVILDRFVDFSHAYHRGMEVASTMPDRKRGLYETADAFISLPGGLGTLEEAMEVLSWRQLGFHEKPSVLLNTNGFYDHLEMFINNMIDGGFVSDGLRSSFIVTKDVKVACDFIESYKPYTVDKSQINRGTFGKKPIPSSDWQAASAHALAGPVNHHHGIDEVNYTSFASNSLESSNGCSTNSTTIGQRVRLTHDLTIVPTENVRSIPSGSEGTVKQVPGLVSGTLASVKFDDGTVADIWPDAVDVVSAAAE